MLPKRNYYLNDYFDMYNTPLNKEYMKTDIYEKNNHYILEIDLPGIKKQDIKINYNNGYLTIKVIKNINNTTTNNYIRRERFYGELKRSFYIGNKKEIDIIATFHDNTLEISFPKEDIPQKQEKEINII